MKVFVKTDAEGIVTAISNQSRPGFTEAEVAAAEGTLLAAGYWRMLNGNLLALSEPEVKAWEEGIHRQVHGDQIVDAVKFVQANEASESNQLEMLKHLRVIILRGL